MTRDQLILIIRQAVAEETGQPGSSILESTSFADLGIDSLSSIVILNKIEDQINMELNPLHMWDYPTVGSFADFLASHLARVSL